MRSDSVPRSKEVVSSPLIQQLKAQAHYLAKLNTIVAEQLTAIKDQCRVAAYKNGVLTLQTDNHALLGQLRYLQSHYLQQLRQHPTFSDLKRMQILLEEPIQVNRVAQNPLPPLSKNVKTLLLETAESIADVELSEALRRLARESSDKSTT
jgi:hypothetical protein